MTICFFKRVFKFRAKIVKVERKVESLLANYSVKREHNEFTRYAERRNSLIFSELVRSASYII